MKSQIGKSLPKSFIHGEPESSIDLAQLPPFLRVLLTMDGTVTKSLEAYFWEPVAVEPIFQRQIMLEEAAPYIGRCAGEQVLSRQVQLRGTRSGRVFIEADSLICTDLLSKDFLDDLEAQKLGVGELLRECGLETYREILELGHDPQVNEVWRLYRIVMEHRPFIQIREHFPLSLYAGSVS